MARRRSRGQQSLGRQSPKKARRQGGRMMRSHSVRVVAACALGLALSGIAFADPTNVSIAPADGARFLVGQKFDLRVQGRGEGPYYATIAIDDVPLEFTSGAQGTTTTDGITATGFGGFN